MHLPRGPTTLLHRAFGGPFGGGCGVGFFPPFGVECTSTTTTTSSTTSPEKTTTKTQKAPTATKTTVIVSPTVVTSVVVVTSGNTITAGTTFTSGTTVTSVITPAPPPTPVSSDTSLPTSSDGSATGDPSSVPSSSPVSSDVPQPTAIPNQTITDTETSVLSNSPPFSVLTSPISSSSLPTTSIPTTVSTPSTPQSSRGMSTGEIAAICIASVGIIAISVLIWLACRRRSARRSVAAASGTPDPEHVQTAPASNVTEPSIRAAAASPAPDSHRMSPDVAERMEEKRDTISRYSDSGETASSPGSSTALSSFPLLSPGPLTPTDAEPAFAHMRSFRLAWDDPPPTPDRRPVSLQSGRRAAYRRSQGGDGYLAATAMENYDRNSVYAAYLAREGGRSEVTLGQPPEYSRY